MNTQEDDAERTHEATAHKLAEARRKGEVPRSADLSTAAGYLGILVAAWLVGPNSIQAFVATLMVLLEQADLLASKSFLTSTHVLTGNLVWTVILALSPWFAFPAVAVILSVLAQRSFVVSGKKVEPKLSRVSLVSNAKNKFGRNGLFEFSKSFVKLLIYSVVLALFIRSRLDEMIVALNTTPLIVAALLARMSTEFLFVVFLISLSVGGIDAVWQHHEHLRKNRMTRKEVKDETKESEGDPHVKQQRRQKGYEIATTQMMREVPQADVVIVNPSHYAVALKWSRKRGEVPICVAKGVDEMARRIRETAMEAGVPIQRDPPTARALFATVEIGQGIDESQFRSVAAAIRFAENMRSRAKAGSWR